MKNNVKPFNKLDPAQVERLALLSEELGEAQQVVGKILRHGYESTHPDSPDVSNRRMLEKELGDILAAISILDEEADLASDLIELNAINKLKKVDKYLHHNKVKVKKYS